MARASAIGRLASLNPGTEIWWDSSPLIHANWVREREDAWRDRPDLLAALEPLRGFSGAGSIFRGSTTNPPLAWQAIEADRSRWDRWTRNRARTTADARDLLWSLYGEVCDRGAAMLEPIYAASAGRFGHICGQVDPRQLTDRVAMVEQAQHLHALRPNVMIKMPATKEGIEGIRILSRNGISTTATLCFSVSQIVSVAQAAQAGFEEARGDGRDLKGCRCCAALMMGRMEGAPQFAEQAAERGLELTDADLRWAGIAVARKAYAIYRQRGYEARLLCASMRLGPVVNGETRLWHLEELAGGEMVLTIFPNILTSFLELYAERELVPRIDEPIPEKVLHKLLGVPYFARAYKEDAISPDEYVDLPGVQITGGSFAQAMQTIDDYATAIFRERA